jgi:hypothetical protein
MPKIYLGYLKGLSGHKHYLLFEYFSKYLEYPILNFIKVDLRSAGEDPNFWEKIIRILHFAQ